MVTQKNVLLIGALEVNDLLVRTELDRSRHSFSYSRARTVTDLEGQLENASWDLAIIGFESGFVHSIELIRAVKQSQAEMPVVVISDISGEAHAVAAMKAGADDYLLKNNVTSLLPLVENLLDNSKGAENTVESGKEQEQLRHLARSVKDIFYTYDAQSGEIWLNDAFGTVFPQGESKERRDEYFIPRIHPEDFESMQQSFAAALEGEQDLWSGKYRIKNGKDEYVLVHDQVYIDRNKDHSVSTLIGALIPEAPIQNGDFSNAENEYFKELCSALPGMVWHAASDGRIRYINSTLSELMGRDLSGQTMDEYQFYIHPDEQQSFADLFQNFESSALETSRRYRLRSANGEYQCIRERCIAIHKGPLSGWLGIGQLVDREEDIPLLKQLKDRERFLKLTSLKSSEVITVLGKDGTILYVSDSVQHIFGSKPEELIGMSGRNWVHKDDVENFGRAFQLLLKDPGKVTNVKMKILIGEDYYDVESDVHSYIDEHGEQFIIANSRDASERESWEQAFQINEEHYRLLFEGMNAGVIITDRDGVIIKSNVSAVEYLGYSDIDAIIDESISSILLAPCDCQHLFTTLVDQGTLRSFEVEYKHPDGDKPVHLLLNASEQRLISGDTHYDFIISDISEIKNVEKTLRTHQKHLQGIIDTAKVIILLLSPEGKILDWNMESERVYMATKSEVLGTNYMTRFLPPEEMDRVQLEMAKLAQGIPIENFENYILDAHGNHHLVQWNATPLTTDADEVYAVLAIGADITERRKAEIVLKENEANLTTVIENTRDSIWSIDTMYRVRTLNSVFKHKFKVLYDVDLNPGDRIIDHLPEEPIRFWTENYDRALHGEHFTLVTQFDWYQEPRDYEISFNPMYGGRKIIGVSVFARDITDRLKTDTTMQYHQNREMLVSSISRSFLNARPDDIEAVSRKAMEQLREFTERDYCSIAIFPTISSGKMDFYASDATKYREVQSLFTDTRTFRWWAREIEAGKVIRYDAGSDIPIDAAAERRFLHSSKFKALFVLPILLREKPIMAIYAVSQSDEQIWNEEDEFIYKSIGELFINLVERKRSYKKLHIERSDLAKRVDERTGELSAVNIELAQVLRLKDEFLSNMSSELRSPLNSVLSLTESLQEQISERLTKKQQGDLSSIEENTRQLLLLINDSLDLSRLEAGDLVLSMDTHDIDLVCKSSLLHVRQSTLVKDIDIRYKTQIPGLKVVTDAARLKQVIINLLSNAVKFTQDGGKVGLEVEANFESGEIDIIVWDSGIGIDKKHLSQLFRPFVQIDKHMNQSYEGTGLGLAIVASLTDLLGGSILVESEQGKGSKFTVTLPISDRTDADNEAISERRAT
jgi:PAS domain S-box-containing protein